MVKKILLVSMMLNILGDVASFTAAEEIRQEFTSKKDFTSFWNISTWSNDEQQYSKSNVVLDTVNGLVRLTISGTPAGARPVNGEITSRRTDFLYGSYRASIKFDGTPGGVVGWFVYRTTDDIHEIDVEYLTEDTKNIHFTLHHVTTNVDYKKLRISFDPTAAFHEYRFDWYPEKVVYFIDGDSVAVLTHNVPDASCSIMLNFWSANMPDWGGPAPTKDACMYVDYMRYYSDPATAASRKMSPLFISKPTDPARVNAAAAFNLLGRSLPSGIPQATVRYAAPGQASGICILHRTGTAPGASARQILVK